MYNNSSNEVRQELALSLDFLFSYQCALLIHRMQRQAMFRVVCLPNWSCSRGPADRLRTLISQQTCLHTQVN